MTGHKFHIGQIVEPEHSFCREYLFHVIETFPTADGIRSRLMFGRFKTLDAAKAAIKQRLEQEQTRG